MWDEGKKKEQKIAARMYGHVGRTARRVHKTLAMSAQKEMPT